MTISTGILRVGILAILAGLIGAYVVQAIVTDEPEVVAAAPPPARIPLAATDLPLGRIISLGDVAMVEQTGEQASRLAPLGLMMTDPSQIIGRRLRQPLKSGQPFTTNLFYLEFTGLDLSDRIKPGYRAFNLQVPDSRGGNVAPGSLVDVIFRSHPRNGDDNTLPIPERTLTLLQSVEVIHVERPRPEESVRSVGIDLRQTRAPAIQPPTITVAVTPEQAERLHAVGGHGEITLSPYSMTERTPSMRLAGEGVSLADILGIEPPPPAPAPFFTEAYRRGNVEMHGYRRDSIVRYRSTTPTKADSLPSPAPATDKTPATILPPAPGDTPAP